MSDIFISFTHKDNARLSDEQHGWIDRFDEALHERLNQLWGRETVVWRDPKLSGCDLLTPSIEAAIRDSLVLVVVLSPSYANSEWCRRELQMFCDAAQQSGGVRAGTQSRIIKVIKTPLNRGLEGQVSTDLLDSVGYPFYRLKGEGAPWEFDPRLGPEARQEFLNEVNDLAYGVCKTLEVLIGSKSDRGTVVPSSGITIYLAETSFDLAPASERLRRELEQFGHTVLPDRAPNHAPGYVERVRKDLARCDLSINPIGQAYGIVPELEERSVVALQYELAKEEEKRRSGFVRLPWMPPELQLSDPRQQAFMELLSEDPQLLVTPLEDLKTTVQDLLLQTSQIQLETPTPAHSLGATRVYLISDPVDALAVQPVEDWLFEQHYEVVRALEHGNERELREDHEENLKSCDAVLIYHGLTTAFWLRSKLRDLQKSFGYGRQRPFLGRAVLVSDPATPDKKNIRSNEVLILPGSGPFEPSMLRPFIKQMNPQQGAAV